MGKKKVDYTGGNKWELQVPDFAKLKELLTTWQLEMQNADGWNAVERGPQRRIFRWDALDHAPG